MNELLVEFLTETNENLAVVDQALVRLEQDPTAPGLLSNIFRLVHTIKGTCGFLGLPRLERLAHAGENVLGKFRDGELLVTPEAITVILAAIDGIKQILSHLEATETEPDGDDAALIATLNRAAEGEEPGAPPEAAAEIEAPAPMEEGMAVALAAETLPSLAEAAPPAQPGTDGALRESAVALQSIRVNVDLLESLMTTVSELVLSRNQLLQIARSQKDSEFAAPLQRLNQVVSELQEGVMKTRMQPIGSAWAKLPRIVRDLAHETGKKIDLVMEGADTELDRQVLELIKDPLTHMVRNSADHGIERPEDRIFADKPETGTIRLTAFHQGGHIILEIGDDGRGLNIDKIKAKAVSKALATEAEIAGLSESQIQQFIFKPGFSTADAVTSVSGRGVGMDVVKTNIEKIGGSIELSTRAGVGSKFAIKIPLTLAIVSALIVEISGQRFAVPQTAVVELVRTSERGTNKLRIERINGAPVLRLRDRLLPLVVLEDLMKLGPDPARAADDDRFVVVTQVGPLTFGMIVDQVFDTEEIVVKPVAPIVRHITVFSGNTILGDGSVIMILDPGGIAAAVGDIAVSGEPVRVEARPPIADGRELRTLLLFRAGSGGPKAVPLSLIARLEKFKASEIETVNGQHVIQYRGKLTPLVPFDPAMPIAPDGRQPALVFADRDRVMALAVDEIVDIVETPVDIHLESDLPGIIGSAIIAGRATELIDASHFVRQAYPDWFEQHDAVDGEKTSGKRVLLIDDSPFFRELVAPLLAVEGYRVTSASSGGEALQLCEQGDTFDIILSDVEMPGMSGYDFALRVKQDARWRHTPLVALTAHTKAEERELALKSGFDDHIANFDRTAILAKLAAS